MRILIVEDETLTAMMMEDYLEEKGFEVVGLSATGEGAVLLAKSQEPDLVFMDFILAGSMNGMEAAALINAERRVPVAMISGYSERAVLQGGFDFKPDAYLSKPIDFGEVDEVLVAIRGPGTGR